MALEFLGADYCERPPLKTDCEDLSRQWLLLFFSLCLLLSSSWLLRPCRGSG